MTPRKPRTAKPARAPEGILKAQLERISQKHLLFETLKTQHGSIDFKEVAAWCVRAALEEAYQLGKAASSASSK
ncbi:DUF6900 domain-containing protein [Myxococcus sp. AM010]|uniref:DUF6900 domain-containing protein n=1 Tax=Myxococcus sp. AM010 TaxID=2745138 RepID=UPI001595032C|nr:hypothetical protein [Myxococcus sp. AM010]NVJ14304.1 hypothetical protein [Myxococcus sp. AM010]